MNIAILSQGEGLYSTRSLLNAGNNRQHNMEVLDPGYCRMEIENGEAKLIYQNEIINKFDAIIPRIGSSNTYYGSSVVRQFEAQGVFSVSTADGILHTRDKWICSQILVQSKIPIPKTVFASFFEYEEQIHSFNGKPIIIKLLEGTHGEGVILTESVQNTLSTIETLNASGIKFVLQEYIEESNGSDIRVIVVDGVAVAAMKRKSKAGDFRSNLHKGGSSEVIELTDMEEKVAIKAAKAMGLGFCGVDILQSKRGPLVLEINSSPGLEGIESTTGKNISKSVIGYIERNKK